MSLEDHIYTITTDHAQCSVCDDVIDLEYDGGEYRDIKTGNTLAELGWLENEDEELVCDGCKPK